MASRRLTPLHFHLDLTENAPQVPLAPKAANREVSFFPEESPSPLKKDRRRLKFEDLEFNSANQANAFFNNDYGILVKEKNGDYEIFILDDERNVVDDTPLGNGVKRGLTEGEVSLYMMRVQDLEPRRYKMPDDVVIPERRKSFDSVAYIDV